jgi:hypothetical protein
MKDHPANHLIHRAWEAALAALRANLLPGLMLQAVMAAMAIAYFLIPASKGTFDGLSLLRSQWGLFFSFVGTSAASVILPEIFHLLFPGKFSNTPSLASRLLFGIPFWGLIGMQVDLFYRLQYFLFGPSDTASVILKKVFVDAFLYCPLLAMPQAVCAFLWRDHGFTAKGFRGHHPVTFYALKVFPVLMANWMVWIPLVSIIYSLPAALGVPFFIIAQAFWVMVFTALSASPQNKA